MLHRFPWIRSYWWAEWLLWFAHPANAWVFGLERQIKESIDQAAMWGNFNADIERLVGGQETTTITLEGQKRTV